MGERTKLQIEAADWTHGSQTLLVPQIDLSAWRAFEESLAANRKPAERAEGGR